MLEVKVDLHVTKPILVHSMYEQKFCSLFVKAKHKVEIGDMGASLIQ